MSGTFGLVDTRHQYYRVFDVYVPIALGVFALILVTVAVAVLIYRRRSPAQAARWHENNPVEGAYALLLTCVVAFLLYLTFSAEHQVDTVANHQRPSVQIDVTGTKWEWSFYYPSQHVTVRSGTTGLATFVVPVNEPVRFTLSSGDVIHAFWIPEVRYKHDLIPGRTQAETLTFPHAGIFPGQCAEFCGLRHADMVFRVAAVPPARFRAWLAAGGKGTPR